MPLPKGGLMKLVRESAMRIYCEHGALTPEISTWTRNGLIELVHFPYDPDSHTPKIPGIAEPSNAQIRDLNLPAKDLPGSLSDYKGSKHFEEIVAIVGCEHRRDALHIDSAFKSQCAVFITTDSDILKHRERLSGLLGISFFNPRIELSDLELLITRPLA
ncbi:MAG TPA: hypothetical protein VHX36_12230 [Candidatus Acidoferrales bacterium]|nr:hypothetical protein [Candidatus Acidoferrales bacterium]